jgi:AcrR family transcriptional regulator
MARQRKASSVSAAWQWSRTAETQRSLLEAAREVFTERGFTEASIAEIVERAGSSVGSLYHHFGGKSELFIALWQQHQAAHEEAASKAVAEARDRGVTDRCELFDAGARAFMDGSWDRRDLAQLFASGDVPPGWEVMRRRRSREWIGQNDSLLRLTDRPEDRVYAAILTSLIGEGAHEVAAAEDRREADKIIDAVCEYARRLMCGGPWHPGPEPLPSPWP